MRETLAELAEDFETAFDRQDRMEVFRSGDRLATALLLAGAVHRVLAFRSEGRAYWFGGFGDRTGPISLAEGRTAELGPIPFLDAQYHRSAN